MAVITAKVSEQNENQNQKTKKKSDIFLARTKAEYYLLFRSEMKLKRKIISVFGLSENLRYFRIHLAQVPCH